MKNKTINYYKFTLVVLLFAALLVVQLCSVRSGSNIYASADEATDDLSTPIYVTFGKYEQQDGYESLMNLSSSYRTTNSSIGSMILINTDLLVESNYIGYLFSLNHIQRYGFSDTYNVYADNVDATITYSIYHKGTVVESGISDVDLLINKLNAYFESAEYVNVSYNGESSIDCVYVIQTSTCTHPFVKYEGNVYMPASPGYCEAGTEYEPGWSRDFYLCNECGCYFLDQACLEPLDVENPPEGFLIPSGHCLLEEMEGQVSTCTNIGYLHHYRCTRCFKRYEDADGTILIDNIVIPKHSFNGVTVDTDRNVPYYHCTVCNNNYADLNGETLYTPSSKIEAPTVTKPSTTAKKDNSLWGLLFLIPGIALLGVGIAYVVRYVKYRRR